MRIRCARVCIRGARGVNGCVIVRGRGPLLIFLRHRPARFSGEAMKTPYVEGKTTCEGAQVWFNARASPGTESIRAMRRQLLRGPETCCARVSV